MERMTHETMLQVGEAMGRVIALLNSASRPPVDPASHPYTEGYRAATVATHNRLASTVLRDWIYFVIGENGDSYATADRMARGDAPKAQEEHEVDRVALVADLDRDAADAERDKAEAKALVDEHADAERDEEVQL